MSRRVREFIEIGEQRSIDALIDRLSEVRASLPECADAEVRLRGDDVFGRRLTVCYYRLQTEEEAECEARYAERLAWGQEFVRQPAGYRGLRRVA